MNIKKNLLAAAIASCLSMGAQAGNIFITGHDADEHQNGAYMAAGLDYLLFGTAQAGNRNKNVAYLNTFGGGNAASPLSGKYNVTTFSANLAGISAALSGGYDAVMVGSGNDFSAQGALSSSASLFTTYFNGGGSLFVNTDEAGGQSWYNFVPQFGTTANNTISVAGVFTPTAAGTTIGLTNTIVDADITHSYYTGVNTSLFTVFETTATNPYGIPVGQAVAIGLKQATIDEGGNFVPEPATTALMMLGLAGLAASRKRKLAIV